MSQITCSRCKQSVDPMPGLPFPGEMGERVQRNVCATCWREWLQAQVNLINEQRLTMVNADHRAMLTAQMKIFLGLEGEAPPGSS